MDKEQAINAALMALLGAGAGGIGGRLAGNMFVGDEDPQVKREKLRRWALVGALLGGGAGAAAPYIKNKIDNYESFFAERKDAPSTEEAKRIAVQREQLEEQLKNKWSDDLKTNVGVGAAAGGAVGYGIDAARHNTGAIGERVGAPLRNQTLSFGDRGREFAQFVNSPAGRGLAKNPIHGGKDFGTNLGEYVAHTSPEQIGRDLASLRAGQVYYRGNTAPFAGAVASSGSLQHLGTFAADDVLGLSRQASSQALGVPFVGGGKGKGAPKIPTVNTGTPTQMRSVRLRPGRFTAVGSALGSAFGLIPTLADAYNRWTENLKPPGAVPVE